MPGATLALVPERRAGWGVAVADAVGVVTATVPAVPGSGLPILDSVMPLLTPLAATGEPVEVVIELLGDEAFCDEVVTAVMRELTAARVWTERSCRQEGPNA